MESYTVEQARLLVGLSQEEIAKRMKLSKNGYIKKEKGVSKFYVDEALTFSEIVKIEFNKIFFG